MKKVRLLILVLLVGVILNIGEVSASTKVNTRTEDDYLVPSSVIVTDANKNMILSTPAIDASEKIYDFAEVLTDSEEAKLYKKINKFIGETSMDLAIVTIKSNPMGDTRKYAHSFYKYNFFKDDGFLFLIDFDKGGIYMTTNGLAYGLFPDSRMQPVLKNVYDKILKKQFYDACDTFVNSISGFVGIGEATEGEDVVIDVDGTVKKNSWIAQALIFSVIGTVIVMIIFVSMNKNVRVATSSREFLVKETMVIKDLGDIHIDTSTSKREKRK